MKFARNRFRYFLENKIRKKYHRNLAFVLRKLSEIEIKQT
jgi:hypothetical protein